MFDGFLSPTGGVATLAAGGPGRPSPARLSHDIYYGHDTYRQQSIGGRRSGGAHMPQPNISDSSGDGPAPLLHTPPQPHHADDGSSADLHAVYTPHTAESHLDSLAELKVENRNLRMRLMYMDELLAKRNVSSSVVNDLIDARQALDMAQRELSEAQRLREDQRVEHTALLVAHNELKERSEQQCKQLSALERIPVLEAALRNTELERDDAITKVLSLQVDIVGERQEMTKRLDEVTDERDAARKEADDAHASKVETLSCERLCSEARMRQLTEEFETIKSDLRAMLEQRTEALRRCERDADTLRASVAELQSELSYLKRSTTDKDDTIDTLQRERSEETVRVRRTEAEIHEALMEREKRIAGLERRAVEQEKVLSASDDANAVYSRALQHALVLLKRSQLEAQRGNDDVSNNSTGDAEPPFLTSPNRVAMAEASSAPDTRQVTSPAAVVLASVLKSSIDDAATAGCLESRRVLSRETDTLHTLFRQHTAVLESAHASQLAKLRKVCQRLAEAGDVVELCVRRRRKQCQQQRELAQEHHQQRAQDKEQLVHASLQVQQLAQENNVLVEELRRVTSDKEVERQALAFTHGFAALSDSVTSQLSAIVLDAKSVLAPPTSLLSADFLESVRGLARKTHSTVEGLHDVIQIAQRQYHQHMIGLSSTPHYATAAAGLTTPRSASVFIPDGSSPANASRTNVTVENLVNQLTNVCVLLDNNHSQVQLQFSKMIDALDIWHRDLLLQWRGLEERLHSSLSVLRQRSSSAVDASTPHVPPVHDPLLGQQSRSTSPSGAQRRMLSSYPVVLSRYSSTAKHAFSSREAGEPSSQSWSSFVVHQQR